MKDCERITVVNKGLSDDEFLRAHKRLCNYEYCLLSNDKERVYFFPKSKSKLVYSLDCGARVSQYHAAILAIKFYLGDYLKNVEII